MFADAASKVIATFLAGVILTTLGFLFGGNISGFLRSSIEINLALLLILAFIALIGVSVVIERIWVNYQSSRKKPSIIIRNEELETTQKVLLEKLSKVEAGLKIHVDYSIKKFQSELASSFDQWEVAVQDYITDEKKERIHRTREHMMGRSLNHSRSEAKVWIRTVKDITNYARSVLNR